MKPQNGTAGIGEISREGYMELNRIHIEEKGKMRHLYEKDLVSTLSELRYYLDIDMPESVQEQKKYGELEEFLNSGKHSFHTKDKILCITNEYGVAAEREGSAEGFRQL
jgi:hypothetical protein